MVPLEDLLNGLKPRLALRFFATFARLEFAMKYSGCVAPANNAGVAHASRSVLSDRLPADFFETVRTSGAARVLFEEPPKNLLIRADRSPAFETAPARPTDTKGLLNAVWQVRNNLFHGNKMYPTNRARDNELMEGALAVIDAILDADQRVGDAFRQPQF